MIVAAMLFIAVAVSSAAAERRGITFDDLIALGRIGSYEISPDGKYVAFTVTWFDKEKNSSDTDIYLVPTQGGEPRRFVRSDGVDTDPCWSPDGRRLAFVSTRGGSAQIWVIPIDGGEATKVTDVPTGVSGPLWSPDGKKIAFVSSVFPGCADMECNKEKLEERESSDVSARMTDRLLYRHWNSWREGMWSHLFLTTLDGGELREINTGYTDCPPISLGGERDYDFSPDGNELCFTMNPDPVVAVSTNNDLWIVPVSGGEPRQLTRSNPANDNNPRYSPDGRYIAWRAQMKAGFEADRHRLMLYDRRTKETRALTEGFDYSVENFDWAPDGKAIYFDVSDKGRVSICRVSVKGNDATFVVRGATDSDVRVTPDGRNLVFPRQTVDAPVDLWRARTDGSKPARLTDINRAVLDELEMNPLEEFWFEGAAGRQVHGMFVRPPQFEQGRRYPVIMLIHGGPQGAFGDEFHYRWNVQMFASPGYVVMMVNFTGSTGYGQAFTDAISGDWGGAPYEDIMRGLDYFVANYDFVDPERIGAAGASYGGYMIDWIEGHTDRFRCLVSHAGVYDLESMYGATEELWFPEWEFGGPPWESLETYEKFSPHRYVEAFTTPCLVVVGERDFRVPYTQGLEFFTALQRRGVPSKLLVYPDEDHFVRKPKNADLWWTTLHEWFAQYLR
jgi:dipeptidyl aminopeptidase/acylaminoacyl peptidase